MQPTTQKTLELAEQVAAVLRARGVEPLLIGALALAVHHHPRHTEDFDIAVALPPDELRELAEALRSGERAVELSLPDADDPLGGVITVRASGSAPVQIVNFDNTPAGGFPALVRDAAASAITIPELPIRVASVVDLILFKLYAGGPKSENDILELLARNRVDLDEVRRRCTEYRLHRELDALLARIPAPSKR